MHETLIGIYFFNRVGRRGQFSPCLPIIYWHNIYKHLLLKCGINRVTADIINRVTACIINRVTVDIINRVTVDIINRVTADIINRVTADIINRVTVDIAKPETSGFRSEADETCDLQKYYAACSGNSLPMLRDNLSAPSSRLKS